MPIPINPPIVAPAVPEKSYDLWFYTDFAVTNITPTSGTMRFTRVPMNSATGEILLSHAEGCTCDLWPTVAALPASAGAAMQAVVSALPIIQAHVQA